MKDRIITVLQAGRGAARDNLARAHRSFGHLSSEELKQEYGQSGSTHNNILENYQTAVDNFEDMIDWVRNADGPE